MSQNTTLNIHTSTLYDSWCIELQSFLISHLWESCSVTFNTATIAIRGR